MARQENQIVGILPLTLVRSRLFGISLSSMPFLNYGGVCTDHQSATDSLYARAMELAREHHAKYLELRNCHPPTGNNPVRLEKATFILHLAETEEQTFASFRKATRNRIRKVDEHGLVLKRGLDIIDDFYAGFAIAMKEHGTQVLPKAFFQSVVKHFGDMAVFYVAYKDGDPAGVKLAMIWRETMFEIWGGYPNKHKARLANYLLSWEATRDAHKMGLKQCDFGRPTRESGPAEFKRYFNCREYQLYWEYPYLASGSLPALNPSNKKFQAAISIWRNLPLSVTKLVGPKLSRYLP